MNNGGLPPVIHPVVHGTGKRARGRGHPGWLGWARPREGSGMRSPLAIAASFLALALGASAAWADEVPGAPPAPPAPPAASVMAAVPHSACCGACLPTCSRLTVEAHASYLADPEGPPGRVSSGLA